MEVTGSKLDETVAVVRHSGSRLVVVVGVHVQVQGLLVLAAVAAAAAMHGGFVLAAVANVQVQGLLG